MSFAFELPDPMDPQLVVTAAGTVEAAPVR